MEIETLLKERKATPEEALAIFDQLEPATLEYMQGQWKGFELITGHAIEGLLEPSGWYGKLFKNPEEVHPLLMYSANRKRLFPINPLLIPLHIKLPRNRLLKILMVPVGPLLKTKKPKARMRMIEYRGKVTGTMVYDQKAINDHFARIDENTMLGAMDLKGMPVPYFFVLERDTVGPKHSL
ncbi:MAG TPA: hypothetical protein DCE41_08315 [Cytophagales bacterium]|nr:hypothetical protein [Cytophagales bacterium]HAA21290.1 hypothetical protein [Cytophagales bacterium]HAP64121.1 hypothetical protein [Cytophagales bacterium]